MDDASHFLASAVSHQVAMLTFDAVRLGTIPSDVAVRAYEETFVSLSGGTLLSLPVELEQGSVPSGRAIFENTDQYAVYLVFLGRALARAQLPDWAGRVFALNKALHGVNIWTAVDMPRHFRLVHSVGTVIGRATFGDYLIFGHGCTVGASDKGEYPVIGSRVSLRAHSSVLGRSVIGDNVAVAAGVTLINVSVPNNTLVVNELGTPKFIESKYPSRYVVEAFGLMD
jgi:serine O-acetyltransferase